MIRTLVLASVISLGMCLPGGYSEVTDTTDLQTYKDWLTGLQTHGLLYDSSCTVTHIYRQIVAGVNIKYVFTCGGGHTCEIVVFDQAWTQTRSISSNTCSHKRQVLVGGYYEQTDPTEVQKYTDKLAEYETNGLLSLPHYKVVKVETQVVAGVNIRYTLQIGADTCQIVVFEQSWTSTKQVTSNTCTHHKRQLGGGGLLGGWNDVSPSNDGIQMCLSKSLDNINLMSNSLFRMVDSQIISAKQQVVAGMNYAVTFQTLPSSCMNNQNMVGKISSDCPVNTNSLDQPSTWSARCYRHLDGTFELSSVNMNEKNTNAQSTVDRKDKLISSVQSGLMQVKNTVSGEVPQKVVKGTSKLLSRVADSVLPQVTLLRKKRNVEFLLDVLNEEVDKHGQDLIEHGKQLLGSGTDHDVINHMKDLLGQDGHDLIQHGQKILGGDGHDLVNHIVKNLGGDGHDLVDHGKNLLGGDGHDLVDHGKNLLGGDGHDLIDHGKNLLGGDGHDLIDHGKNLLGGDDHDLIDHGKNLLGGDDHDLVDHGKNLLGGDDHDLVDHGKNLLGGDDHDLIDRGKNLLGGDGHDQVDHGKKLIGGDGHDQVDHGKLIGGDGHDQVDHGKKLLGGDDHDLKFHGSKNTTVLIGGDDHDYCHKGMFLEFKQMFGKMYGSNKEEEKRYLTFCDNMKIVRKLQETEKGTAKYGATKFADLTRDEFRQYVGKKWDITANQLMKKADIPKGSIPDSFDWRDNGAVTPVKNQGQCGSCWAFSTTGNIEGQWALRKKQLISLSEQELVDCDKLDEGCNGGLPSNAYKEIERLGGLETETDYSYKAEDEKCKFDRSEVKVYINDSVSISSDEKEMASWLVANGPISIGINAFAMQFYMGGISHPWKIFCNPADLDHGVLIVGYGIESSKPYWIVKNSWGPDWGEKGYYLVYRGAGVCGLNTMCTSAVVN